MRKIFLTALAAAVMFAGCGKQKEEAKPVEKIKYVVTAVSYTHLTLPTT